MKEIDENEIIAIIKDSDVGYQNKELNNPEIRYAARGIVINKDADIAIFNKKKKNEFKLPGGGIESDEKIEVALKREILEETGCLVEIEDFLGITIEEKSLTNFKQISYIFTCFVTEDTKVNHLTEKEKAEGGSLIFVSPKEALDLISNSFNNLKGSEYDNLYRSLFMVKRDALIVSYYLNKKIEKVNKK